MTSDREPPGNHLEPPPSDQGKQAGTTPPPFGGRWFPEPVPSEPTIDPLPSSVGRLIDRLADRAEATERRRHQLAVTFTKVNGRPPADDTELDDWLTEITTRSRP